MKQTVYESDFRSAFHNMGRGEQFSYEGLGILYEALQEMEEASGVEMELDVIALCCEFSEMDADEVVRCYDVDVEDVEPDDIQQAVEEYLQDHTYLCGVTDSGAFVFQQF